MSAPPALWRPTREDRLPLLAILLLPLLVVLPQMVGLFDANPMLYVGDLARHVHYGRFPGFPYIDPNDGFTTQALGRLAADMWLHGTVPWWNSYSGVGMPLAGEYQPGAFSPLTLLLLLPNGVVWRHLALQWIAGWGCYGLLRQLGPGRLAALTGGLLFAQNGALAWFAHAPPDPACFLPWLLLGIERATVQARVRGRGGWRLTGFAMGLMLLAGFPETAYICGLFALVWSALRLLQMPAPSRFALIWRVALGGVIGIALAAPQILAFAEFVPLANVGGHGGGFGHAALVPAAAIPSLLAPYAFGPIFAFSGQWPILNLIWGNVGGYADLIMLVLAAYGLLRRRDALSVMLLVWILLCLAKTFGVPPLAPWWNFVPGISQVAFFRYATASWELALILLIGFGIEALAANNASSPLVAVAAAAVFALGAGWGLAYGIHLWPQNAPAAGLRHWADISVAWALLSGALAVWLLVWGAFRWRAQAVAALMVLDATVMFAVPTFSTPRRGKIDTAAIGYLQQNLGLQRFYTLGPIAPNYGAYFKIAAINHNYLPVPSRWTDWVRADLDPGTDPVSFTGNFHPDPSQPTPAQALRHNLPAYEAVGVKYVVTPPVQNPFAQEFSTTTHGDRDHPLALASGQSVQGVFPVDALTESGDVDGFGLLLGNYGNTSDGDLVVTLCQSGRCVSASANLTTSHDNTIFWIKLPRAASLNGGVPVSYRIIHQGGHEPVALWEFPDGADQHLIASSGAAPGFGLQIHLRRAQNLPAPRAVYADDLMEIYQLPDPRPYFDTGKVNCDLQPLSRASLIADCPRAATLVRRELFFPGWRARIGTVNLPIVVQDDLFQAVSLPAGKNRIDFSFSPPHIMWAWLAMGVAFGALLCRRPIKLAD